VLLAAWLCSCGTPGEPGRRDPPNARADEVVARIDGKPVTATELDDALRLPLYDLERARYELRLRRLQGLLAGRRGAAEILLPEPEPPVVAVAADDDPVRGPVDAPVTLIEFVDFQSPYCQRMQPIFRRLLDDYPTQVRLVVRDFPLAVHRDALRAAEAAACAGAEGAYWPYHDVLLQERDDLGRAALERHATRVGIDAGRLGACLDQRRMRAEVEHDAADARRLGVSVVPTTFVNGRYLKGPQPYEVLRAWIDRELARLGVPGPRAVAPGRAVTTTVVAHPDATGGEPPPAGDPEAGGSPIASTITLSAAEVQRALARPRRLRRDLENPPFDPGPGWEGRRVVRVRRVRPGSLYAAMGLRPQDVVVLADGAPVLDDGRVLFDALRDRGRVTLTLLRRGLPVTYEYVVR
jgi:protein-disulfide isomerase